MSYPADDKVDRLPVPADHPVSFHSVTGSTYKNRFHSCDIPIPKLQSGIQGVDLNTECERILYLKLQLTPTGNRVKTLDLKLYLHSLGSKRYSQGGIVHSKRVYSDLKPPLTTLRIQRQARIYQICCRTPAIYLCLKTARIVTSFQPETFDRDAGNRSIAVEFDFRSPRLSPQPTLHLEWPASNPASTQHRPPFLQVPGRQINLQSPSASGSGYVHRAICR